MAKPGNLPLNNAASEIGGCWIENYFNPYPANVENRMSY
jgi:hypothetical protein